MKNSYLFLVIAQCALAVGILLNHFAGASGWISFLIGLFTGLSLAMNLAFIWTVRKERTT